MRLVILMLSMGSVAAYGYALAGWGVQFVSGAVNYVYVTGGLSGGTFSALLAIFLWKRWLAKEAELTEKNIGEKSGD